MSRVQMILSVLIVLFIGVTESAARDISSSECYSLIESVIHVPLADLPRISVKNPIPIQLVQDEALLRKASNPTCGQEIAEVRRGLLAFFSKRLDFLLSESSLKVFHEEFTRALSQTKSSEERRALAGQLGDTESEYLKSIHHQLLTDLQRSPWRHYKNFSVTFENWNEEWLRVFGRELPAGTLLGTGRIAIDTYHYGPEALKVILFHELAHQEDPSAPNELAAWRKTLSYLDWRKATGQTIPQEVAFPLLANIRILGLEQWVRGAY